MLLFFTFLNFLFQTTKPIESPAYEYQLEVKQLKEPTQVRWGYWLKGKAFLIDSTLVDPQQPAARFSGKINLPAGLYFFQVGGNSEVLEFVINEEYKMAFHTQLDALQDSFTVQKSVENEPYFNWKKQKKANETKINLLKTSLQTLQKTTRDPAILEKQAKEIRRLREEFDAYSRQLPIQFPNALFAALIKADLPPAIPSSISLVTPDGNVNPAYMRYFRAHLWDNVNFQDLRLLRSPVLARKADEWMQLQPSQLDSVKVNLDYSLQKTIGNAAFYTTMLQLFMERFDLPSYGGNETMLVYLFDQYFPNASAVEMDTATWMRLQFKANAYRPTLPGRIAPTIELPDSSGSIQSLHKLQATFTLLYFFHPSCAQCQLTTPNVYEQTKPYLDKGLKVYAVSTDMYEIEDWKQYTSKLNDWTCVYDSNKKSSVEKMYATQGLPNLVLLDEQKKILVRRLPAADLAKVLASILGSK